MDIPTLVLKKTSWRSPDGDLFSASSAPYLESAMGQMSKLTTLSDNDLDQFLSNLNNFSPRKAVSETFSLISCASSLVDILKS